MRFFGCVRTASRALPAERGAVVTAGAPARSAAGSAPADPVWWLHEMRGGYGYVERVPAYLICVRARRVGIAALRRDGYWCPVWVCRSSLEPRRGVAAESKASPDSWPTWGLTTTNANAHLAQRELRRAERSRWAALQEQPDPFGDQASG